LTVTAFPSFEDPPHPARILVVDDVPANLLAMEALLAPLGEEVVCVDSGDAALSKLLRTDFAVILMDVQMPRLDGLETARLIRARERTRGIPIIFITALSREAAHVTRGYAEGGVDYLLKPVDPEILRAKVSAFIELHQQRERLKVQAVELAAQRRAQEALLQARELEEQLVGIVGHDIKSPLSAVLATSQGQLASAQLEPAQRRAFERIARSGQRIAGIVDLLLDFTRARVGGGIPLARRRTDLLEVCRRTIDEVEAAQPDRVITLEGPAQGLWGEWDPDRLAQVLTNLLDNALKYGSPGSPVRVLQVGHPEGDVTLCVHNEGEPIPASLQATLFEPFRRAATDDPHARTSLGLGLFISRELVRMHGGELEVRSDASGTDFELRLPRSATAPHSARPPGHQLSA